MAFGSKHLGTGKSEVRTPSPRRDGVGAALRHAVRACEDLPDEFERRLTRIDAVSDQRRTRRG
jgi:hypothetical protein